MPSLITGALPANEPIVAPGLWHVLPNWFRPLSALMGAMFDPWNEVAYDATRFTASGSQTWAVEEADVTTMVYQLRGRTMLLAWALATTVVGGTPSTQLRIAIPRGLIAKRTIDGVYRADDNGTVAAALCRVTAGNTYVELYRNINGTGNWAAGTSGVSGHMTFEVAEAA